MTTINDADNVLWGAVGADAVYLNGVKVWPSIEPTTITLSTTDTTVDYTGSYSLWGDVTAPVGQIQFMKNGAAFGAPITVNLQGRASAVDTITALGDVVWEAHYLGTPDYGPSDSNPLTVTGVTANTTTTCSAPSSTVQDTPITISATVRTSSGSSVTGGTVQFHVSSSTTGAASNIGGAVAVNNGSASIGWTPVQPYCGSLQFTATYSGATDINGSSGTDTCTASQKTILTIYDWWPDNQSCTRGQFPQASYYVTTTDGRPAAPGEVKGHLHAMGGNGTMYYPVDANGYGVTNMFAVNSWDPVGPTTLSVHYRSSTFYEDSSTSIPWTIT